MHNPNDTLQNGRYHIMRRIGQGGMGAVYEAYDTRLKIRVALKEALFTDTALLRAFEREAQRLARLRHSALPNLIDHFMEGQGQYLVMEYIEGQDLNEALKRRGQPFPVAQVMAWADQLLDALTYLHSRQPPVIHRDIKPANVKVTPEGQIILLDFGLAKGGLSQLAPSESLHGATFNYAPLEQLRGQSTDSRSDLYALGATLYHLLTGQAPENAFQRYAERPNSDPLRPANQLNAQIPAHVADVLTRAMALDAAQRPANAVQMRADLFAPSQTMPLDATQRAASTVQIQTDYDYNAPTSQPIPPSSLPAWQRWVAPLMGALLLLVVSAVVLGWIFYKPDTKTEVAVVPSHPAPTSPAICPPTSIISREPDPLRVLQGTPVPQPVTPISIEDPSNVNVTELARWGNGVRNEVAYSPDGKWLVMASSLGIYVYDAQTLCPVRLMESDAALTSVAFSPEADNPIIAAGSMDKMVHLWSLDGDGNAQYIRSLGGERSQKSVTRVAFSPDGKILASGSSQSSATLYLWQVPQVGSEEDSRRELLLDSEPVGVNIYDIGFSPDGKKVALVLHGKPLQLGKIDDNGTVSLSDTNIPSVWRVEFSPDGETLATGSRDRTVGLWRVSHQAESLFTDTHSSPVQDIAYSANGEMLATGGSSGEVYLWAVSNGNKLQPLGNRNTDGGAVASMSFSPDNKMLVARSQNGAVHLWQVPNGRLLIKNTPPLAYTGPIQSVAISRDGALIASGSGKIQLWNAHDGTPLFEAPPVGGKNSVAISPDGQRLAFDSTDRTVQVWEMTSQQLFTLPQEDKSEVFSVAISPDGTLVASASKDNTLRLWDLSNYNLLHELKADAEIGIINQLAFSPDNQMLASASEHDKTVRLWETASGKLLKTLPSEQPPSSVTFSPDGQILAEGYGNGMVLLRSLSDDTPRNPPEMHTARVNSLAFSPDGKILASASSDDTVRLWRVSDGLPVRSLKGHTDAVNSVVFSADGKMLISGSTDGTMRLWGMRP